MSSRRGRWWVGLLAASAIGAAEPESSLISAIKRSDTEHVERLLSGRPGVNDVNARDADGTTALHWAAFRDNATAVKRLVAMGAKPDALNRYGMTPLILASQRGSGQIVESLLDAGANPNLAAPAGDTPLMNAARSGSVAAVQALVNGGADVNTATPGGQTALMWAAAGNHVAAVEALLTARADLTARSTGERGFTPFLFAVRAGALETVRLLLDAGADPNDRLATAQSAGMSALVLAVASAKFDVASELLDYGADPNGALQGWTALHQLTWVRRPNEGLVNPGPVARGNVESLALAEKLLQYGADPNARMTKEPESFFYGRNVLNRIGATPFFMAAFRLDLPLMRFLVANGADPLLPNADETTPLMVAAGVGFFADGENPYTDEEALDGVKFCLALGGDVTAVDMNGDTALHGAAFRGVNEVVKLLVKEGARLDHKNNKRKVGLEQAEGGGWTPWRIAQGFYLNAGLRQKLDTARLLKQMMQERGLWTEEEAAEERRAR